MYGRLLLLLGWGRRGRSSGSGLSSRRGGILPARLDRRGANRLGHLPDLRMNLLIGHDLVADGDGFVILATRIQRRCLAHLVSRLGVSRAIRRVLELGK